jgi:hypothetical protein
VTPPRARHESDEKKRAWRFDSAVPLRCAACVLLVTLGQNGQQHISFRPLLIEDIGAVLNDGVQHGEQYQQVWCKSKCCATLSGRGRSSLDLPQRSSMRLSQPSVERGFEKFQRPASETRRLWNGERGDSLGSWCEALVVENCPALPLRLVLGREEPPFQWRWVLQVHVPRSSCGGVFVKEEAPS